MALKKINDKNESPNKEEINKLKSELEHYQLALDNTKHSKRRQELEQKITEAEEQLKELQDSEGNIEGEKQASPNGSRNIATLIRPLNASVFTGLGIGIVTGILLKKAIIAKD